MGTYVVLGAAFHVGFPPPDSSEGGSRGAVLGQSAPRSSGCERPRMVGGCAATTESSSRRRGACSLSSNADTAAPLTAARLPLTQRDSGVLLSRVVGDGKPRRRAVWLRSRRPS